MASPLFEKLFSRSRDVTPYLCGELGHIDNQCIHISHNNNPAIRALYQELADTSPEAGQAYWLTRTWGLLCWQPIYLALIAVYSLKALPDITRIGQRRQPCFVAGFRFEDQSMVSGSHQDLIVLAGKQLQALFECYREGMEQWVRIRPGFTRSLVADTLLACLLRILKDQPPENVRHEAQLWLKAGFVA